MQIKLLLVCLLTALFAAACGGGSTNNSANSNGAKNTNSNSSNSNANTKTAAVSDKPPIVTTADNLQLSSDFIDAGEFPGRMVTVSGYINFASKTKLVIGYGYGSTASGNSVDCVGDFSQYSGIEERANGLAKENKALKATVKGSVKSSEDKTLTLDPCVLSDVAK